MSNTNLSLSSSFKAMFDKWYKICALLICIGIAAGGLGFAVQQGALTPEQSQGLIGNLAQALNQRVDALNATLITTWTDTIGDPSYSVSSLPPQYMISNVSGYYCLMDSVNGVAKLDAFNLNSTYIENMALGNISSGTIYLKEVAHNTALTIPDNVIRSSN